MLLLSSQEKLYVLLVGVSTDLQESSLSLLCSHTIGDIRDVSVGLGLQVVRLVFHGSALKIDYVPMSHFPSGLGYVLGRMQSTFS